jgi:hypothetical protein
MMASFSPTYPQHNMEVDMPGLKKNTIAAEAALLLYGAAVAGPSTANTGWIGDECLALYTPPRAHVPMVQDHLRRRRLRGR